MPALDHGSAGNMLVGTRVLARREDDLEAEEGIIKKLHSVGGATVANVRLLDGYMVPNVPVEELVAVKADVAAAASRPQGGELSFDTDTEYDETVGPQLPEPPAEPQGEAKYAWAAAYKEVGNGLFKQGKHEWALRTYLNGVQQLHRLGYADDPERMFTDVAAWSVCAASFSNAALCALKLGRYELAVQCCDRGLRFAVSDAERAKLQARKGQARPPPPPLLCRAAAARTAATTPPPPPPALALLEPPPVAHGRRCSSGRSTRTRTRRCSCCRGRTRRRAAARCSSCCTGPSWRPRRSSARPTARSSAARG